MPTARIGSRALGVDYGLRRIGLAVSVGVAPRTLPRIEHVADPTGAAAAVARAASGTVSETIVVGMPVDAKGGEGEQVFATRLFLDKLILAAPWAKIVTLDERYTTQEAKEALRDEGVSKEEMPFLLDGAAAAILLKRYFAESGEEPAVVVQEGVREVREETVREEAVSFAQWKRAAMERAKKNSGGKRKPKR